ncbi:hypothetical protein RIF29_18826 [Crotalaria pallida]|uniref:Uncharacterized protein n=1 Tax=Crotalaria pallida TaxID=3830 RepID=A0AAN9I5W9_CROPI
MAILSDLSFPANYSGFLHPYLPSKLPARIGYHKDVSLTPTMICGIKIKQKYTNHIRTKVLTSAARNDQYVSSGDGLPQEESFLLTFVKDIIWGIRSLFVFLAEQPSQLKYIEWPSFGHTLRTAILTLALVAILIVALSSVDSVLYYVLALVLRKSS